VVILQVYPGGASVPPFESYAPVAGHVNAVAFGFSLQQMKIPTRDVHVPGTVRECKRNQLARGFFPETGSYLGATSFIEKKLKSLVAEAPYRGGIVT